jgi:hypothetical protein
MDTVETMELIGTPDPDSAETPNPETPEAEAKKAEEKKDDPLKGITRELKQMRKQLEEARSESRYWYEEAKKAHTAPQAEAAEDDDKPLSVDLVDAISSGDRKAIKQALKELGMVEAGEVEARIQAARGQIESNATLLAQYPDLGDNSSEMFALTREIYQELAEGSSDSPQQILQKAAKQAARHLDIQPRGRKPARQAEDEDEDAEEREQERVRRVARQSGGGRRGAPVRDRDPEELSASQNSIIERFRAVGARLTAEGYRKRASEGIRMAGVPRGKR